MSLRVTFRRVKKSPSAGRAGRVIKGEKITDIQGKGQGIHPYVPIKPQSGRQGVSMCDAVACSATKTPILFKQIL
jgi:hypothetical protein